MLIAVSTKADVIVNALAKYGPNGYEASGNSSSSSSKTQKNKHKFTTSSTSTNTLDVEDRYELTPGVGVQRVPSDSGVCVGGGYYLDNTLEMSVGWKF